MRLIDADALKRKSVPLLFPTKMEPCGHIPVPVNAVVVAEIEQAATIDAVPVVRCRECKHHRDKNEHERQYLAEGVLICTSPEATDDCWNAVWPDHFCSYGERKEGAD